MLQVLFTCTCNSTVVVDIVGVDITILLLTTPSVVDY